MSSIGQNLHLPTLISFQLSCKFAISVIRSALALPGPPKLRKKRVSQIVSNHGKKMFEKNV